MLHQIAPRPGLVIVGMPGFEPVAVLHYQLGHILSVRGIVFGSRRREGFPIPRQSGGVDGKEHQKVILQKREQQGTARLLQAYGNLLSLIALAQAGEVLFEWYRATYVNR